VPLLGANGIFPVKVYLQKISEYFGGAWGAFWQAPSLFWLNAPDPWLQGLAYLGAGLSLLVVIGFADSILFFLLWVLYLSFLNVGQLFYGYGWETMLLETGFLAIFFSPLFDPRSFTKKSPPSLVVVWLLRWVLFRVMFGAALIKLRGDPCWRDLTCLDFHFETQPLPNPLSWYFNQLPHFVLKGGVLFNYLAELIAPWMLLGPRRLRHLGGLVMLAFQIVLILSGNLSWLNWLTLALCFSCFDDELLKFLFPKSWRERVNSLVDEAQASLIRRGISYGLAAVVLFLSIEPVLNLISPEQAMNLSYNPLHLVNTYGAFGSVTQTRREIILEGTEEENPNSSTQWREYQFKCKPGDIHRAPCVVSPYHYRLDWQMWFAAMGSYEEAPWVIRLVQKLLEGDKNTLGLMSENPFPDKPPKFIRAQLYEYHLTRFQNHSPDWWRRERIGTFLPALSL
jgi:uncharacterized protein YjeT (DUF2065 family)